MNEELITPKQDILIMLTHESLFLFETKSNLQTSDIQKRYYQS